LQKKKLKAVIIEALGTYVYIREPLEGSFSAWMRDLNAEMKDEEQKGII